MYPALRTLRGSSSSCLRDVVRSMSSGKLTTVEVNEKTGVATLTMNRPPVNGLNLDLLRDIHNSIEDIESNKCRGLILTSVSIWTRLLYRLWYIISTNNQRISLLSLLIQCFLLAWI